jgi:hypothetical protein
MTPDFILFLHLVSWSRNPSRSQRITKSKANLPGPMTGLIEPQPISPLLLRDQLATGPSGFVCAVQASLDASSVAMFICCKQANELVEACGFKDWSQ